MMEVEREINEIVQYVESQSNKDSSYVNKVSQNMIEVCLFLKVL